MSRRPLIVSSLAAASLACPAAAGAQAGPNLLRNSGAEVGAASLQGWDAVTIPGWEVASGLPTVVGYGTRGYPRRGPGQLFVGGAGGTARLSQTVPLGAANGRRPRAGTAYTLSAALGGTTASRASVSVTFLSAGGGLLGHARLRPVGGPLRSRVSALRSRGVSGRLPLRARAARVTVTLATSLTNADGPNAPLVGFDRAVADNVRFSVGPGGAPPPPLSPPTSRVPRYDHVFLFYFENQDVRAIVGNRRQAPYFNSLLPQGSELGRFFAEEHPSDGNYLALAGGSAFGIPLDDPLEYDSQYTIRARNIGDLVDAAHETWRAYNESAAGPCDDTVHGYYWNDDLPLNYFADFRGRPAYCAAHELPLESMAPDLSSAATTPSFVWVGANDCDDMEGCGIRAGDRFLKTQLGAIMRSPAWRTQRSLAIITWDEDAYDHERPAQWVPTLVLGSTGVRRGYVSRVRYTHYSMLRTIEGALGLGRLTANDRYAAPVNDVFSRAAHAHRARRGSQTAFVVSSRAGTVTPIALASRRAGAAIHVGRAPVAVALTPDDRTAYVVNSGSASVTPIDTTTLRTRRAILVGADPRAIAITPDGATAYVADSGAHTVTPITLRTATPGPPIPVGAEPRTLVLTPDGRTLYALNWGGRTVTAVDTATNRQIATIPVGAFPSAAAITADGATVYVVNYGSDTVTPITVATNLAGPPIPAGQAPDAIALTPDGATAEVVDGATDRVTAIDTRRGRVRWSTPVGSSPTAVAIAGHTAFVVSTITGTVTPIDTLSGHAGRAISVGTYSYPTAIGLAPGGKTATVLGTYDGTVRLLNTRTRRASGPITVGALPVAAAVTH